MWEYTEKMMKYFTDPQNVGEIENADAIGEVGNVVCGDALRLTLKIDRRTGIIEDAKFRTFGCASAIASSSVLTEMVKGKTVDEASRITNKDIADFLGGLPAEKMHCSVMGMEALEKAIKSYRGEEVSENERVVCKCFGVTEDKIRRAVKENDLTEVEQVTNYTKAGGACGGCKLEIKKILDEVCREKEENACGKKDLTNLERIRIIKRIIEEQVRPKLRSDGGDIELVDVEGRRVSVRLKGRCSNCPASSSTIKSFVEKKMRDSMCEKIIVEEVKR